MENASKALMMAASVLMSLIVISALFFMFRQLGAAEQTEADVEEMSQVIEYSNRFEQYNRTLYGSEVLSLANLQEDYNLLKADYKGYAEVTIQVKIKTAIIENGKTYIQASNAYQDIKTIADRMIKDPSSNNIITSTSRIENDIEFYEKDKKYRDKNGKERTVKEFSQLGNRKIAELMNQSFHSDDMDYDIGENLAAAGGTVGNLMSDITKYKNIKTAYVQFKNTKFKCTFVDYDENGRVKIMRIDEQ